MPTRPISNSDDIIDSRDVIARIEELREERGTLREAVEEAKDAAGTRADHETAEQFDAAVGEYQDAERAVTEWEESDEAEELAALEALAEEGSRSPDWEYGETLINDDYFQTYAQELAEDIGAIDRNATWPNQYIDWARASDALKGDYTSVDFDGVTYWIRS